MQLRNLVWAISKHDVCLIHHYSVMHWSLLTGNSSEIINFAGHVPPTELIDAERGVCEKALGVLDCICDCKQGKELAKSNALTLPLVIKKLLRVSDLSSSFAVSIVWKLCVKTEENLLIEVLQVGVFQKLLVMLQVGCGDSKKEKATELLKLLNGYRNKAECVDSSSLDFKHLKKPF